MSLGLHRQALGTISRREQWNSSKLRDGGFVSDPEGGLIGSRGRDVVVGLGKG